MNVGPNFRGKHGQIVCPSGPFFSALGYGLPTSSWTSRYLDMQKWPTKQLRHSYLRNPTDMNGFWLKSLFYLGKWSSIHCLRLGNITKTFNHSTCKTLIGHLVYIISCHSQSGNWPPEFLCDPKKPNRKTMKLWNQTKLNIDLVRFFPDNVWWQRKTWIVTLLAPTWNKQ